MKKMMSALFWVITVSLIMIVLVFGGSRLSGIEFRSAKESMSSEIPGGSLVAIMPMSKHRIKVGDDIAFVTENGNIKVRSIIEINLDENEFVTESETQILRVQEPPKRYENIIGVVKWKVPYAGKIVEFLSTTQGKTIAIIGVLLAVIISTMVGIVASTSKKQENF